MTNFTFNSSIPDTGNNPSNDQPDMLTNNISTNGLLAVDHVSFNSDGTLPQGGGGQHLQINFDNKYTQPAQIDPHSVLYTVSGTASTKADMNFKNENGVFPVNVLRAFGVLTTTNTAGVNVPVTLDMGVNIGPIVRNLSGLFWVYTIPITVGATTGTTVAVIVTLSDGSVPSWSFTANTLTVNVSFILAPGLKLSFFVYQV